MDRLTKEILSDHRQALIVRMESKPTVRSKVDAVCIKCIYEPWKIKHWRLQVSNCNFTRCAIHPFRAKPKHNQK